MLLSYIQQAFRQNLKPGLALQSLAVILVLCYYFVPASNPFFNLFGQLKSEYGIRYTMISTAIFGGLIPFIYLFFAGNITHRPLAQLSFYLLIWAFQGSTVDIFYGFQGEWFGYDNDPVTLAQKVAVDQFLFSAFYAAPFLTLMFLWKESDFSFTRWKSALNREVLTLKIPANVIANWTVWIPAVTAVYAMPQPLQIPLFNIVLCFWVLMLAVLNKGD